MKDYTVYTVLSTEGVETRRTDKKVAEEDVAILRWLGKKAWIDDPAQPADLVLA